MICQGGMRSAQAIAYLANEYGHSNLINIDGGTMAWANAGHPIKQGEDDGS
jgi:rhodanese-related sulfurtransferase